MTAKISVGHAEYETCDCYIIVCMYCKNLWVWNLVTQTHALNCYHNLLIVISAPTSTGSLFDLFELAFSQISRFLSLSLSLLD